mmetsp:Transcript_110811/g.236699  ORF Transcript_110811/g.236699 Transcript_110811/m.236699 type:complete len:205 (-) Transcript_110811:27-641(-)
MAPDPGAHCKWQPVPLSPQRCSATRRMLLDSTPPLWGCWQCWRRPQERSLPTLARRAFRYSRGPRLATPVPTVQASGSAPWMIRCLASLRSGIPRGRSSASWPSRHGGGPSWRRWHPSSGPFWRFPGAAFSPAMPRPWLDSVVAEASCHCPMSLGHLRQQRCWVRRDRARAQLYSATASAVRSARPWRLAYAAAVVSAGASGLQ